MTDAILHRDLERRGPSLFQLLRMRLQPCCGNRGAGRRRSLPSHRLWRADAPERRHQQHDGQGGAIGPTTRRSRRSSRLSSLSSLSQMRARSPPSYIGSSHNRNVPMDWRRHVHARQLGRLFRLSRVAMLDQPVRIFHARAHQRQVRRDWPEAFKLAKELPHCIVLGTEARCLC